MLGLVLSRLYLHVSHVPLIIISDEVNLTHRPWRQEGLHSVNVHNIFACVCVLSVCVVLCVCVCVSVVCVRRRVVHVCERCMHLYVVGRGVHVHVRNYVCVGFLFLTLVI